MKLLLHILIALLLIPLTVSADNKIPTLVVWHKNGRTTRIELGTLAPVTTFKDGKITISRGFGSGNHSSTFSISDILRYTFENVNDEANGVNDAASNDRLLLKWQNDGITLLNLKEGTQVKVYAADGKLLQTLTAHEDMPLTVTVAGHPDGVYIIKTAGRSFKLLKQ